MKPTPIVFLDLDGVLRLLCELLLQRDYPEDILGCPGQPKAYFDSACVWRLNRLLAAAGAQFVIISTLRAVHPWELVTRALQAAHVNMTAMHIDANVPWTGRRGDEVQQWLLRHPEVTNWCVFDDEMRHYDDWVPALKAHVFATCSRFGLQPTTELAALKFLQTTPNTLCPHTALEESAT